MLGIVTHTFNFSTWEANLFDFEASQNPLMRTHLKQRGEGNEEMAQWLEALTALQEGLDTISSTYMMAYNFLQLQLRGLKCLLLPSMGTTHAQSGQICMQVKYPYP